VTVRIGLVGCVKTKLSYPARAEDLYTSPLFRGRRSFVERTCERWFILSAKYGLVDPQDVLSPYEQTLKTSSEAERRAWSRGVLDDLERRLDSFRGHQFEIHAGAEYRDHGLVEGLLSGEAEVTIPTHGLSFGQQLAFYGNQSD
jgi:hypothetical protein